MEEETAEVSYSICAGERGKGHGKRMIRLLLEKIKADFPQISRVRALVKPENSSSQRIFSDAGFNEAYIAYEREL